LKEEAIASLFWAAAFGELKLPSKLMCDKIIATAGKQRHRPKAAAMCYLSDLRFPQQEPGSPFFLSRLFFPLGRATH